MQSNMFPPLNSGLDLHGNQYCRPDCKECMKPVIKVNIEANKDIY